LKGFFVSHHAIPFYTLDDTFRGALLFPDDRNMTVRDKTLILVSRFYSDLLALIDGQCNLSFGTYSGHDNFSLLIKLE